MGFAIVEVAEWEASMVVRQRQRLHRGRQGLAGAGLGLPDSALSVTDLALNSSDPGKLLMDLEQNLFELPTTALLGSLERMRKTLFGGGTMSLTNAMRAFDDYDYGRRRSSNSSNSSSSSSSNSSGSSSSRRRGKTSGSVSATIDRHTIDNRNSNSMDIQRRSAINDSDNDHHHFDDDDDVDDDWFSTAVGGITIYQ